jgi:Ca2+-binding RTX toxin-like protein
MKRTIVLMATTMLFAVFVFGGVAYALTIQCDGEGDQDPALLQCFGTADSDKITGNNYTEEIHGGFGGNDTIRALGGGDVVSTVDGTDRVFGDDGEDIVLTGGGNDVIHGGPGNDGSDLFITIDGRPQENLSGGQDSDTVHGDDGDDFIDAAQGDTAGSFDRSYGGTGNDHINAFDGNTDAVNCGDGGADVVYFDPGLDSISRSCEITHDTGPPPGS